MSLGEKLPALVNASLTLVPGDGLYCFGTLPIIIANNRRLRSLYR